MEDNSIIKELLQTPIPDIFNFFEYFQTDKTEEEQRQIIKNSIKQFLKNHKGIKPTNTLILVVHQILVDMFINKIRFIAIEAPTGSGKSVIGYCLAETFKYCLEKIFNYEGNPKSYLLTSSKMLQKQIQGDFKRFEFDDSYAMLKGTANYPCTFYYFEALNAEIQKQKLLGKAVNAITNTVKPDKSLITTYDKRPCISYDPERRSQLNCFPTCQYIIKRAKAACAMCANLNYAYYLTVLNSNASAAYFGSRFLTICDEAHLIPDIVCSLFQYEFTPATARRIKQSLNAIIEELPSDNSFYEFSTNGENNYYIKSYLFKKFEESKEKDSLFLRRNVTFDELVEYAGWCSSFYDDFKKMLDEYSPTKEFKDLAYKYIYGQIIGEKGEVSQKEKLNLSYKELKELAKRPEDIFIKYEDTGKYGKYYVRDLSEQELIRNKLLSHMSFGVFMSATLGNTDQFGELLGIKKEQYKSYRMEPTFDYSKSPIYKCNVGSLTQKNFSSNIDNCLDAVIYISHCLHPDEKGIIHTATFNITDLLKDKITDYVMKGDAGKFPGLQLSRFRFYKTPQEKDKCVEELKNSETPLIIVGPSLYEGLDLKYDEGRFNILIKVPYPALDAYVKAKMQRIEFWYERVTIEKIVQAIGRTNRAVDDYSKTYLIDSTFSWLVPKMFGSKIQERIQSLYLDIPHQNDKPKKMYSFDDFSKNKQKTDDEKFADIWDEEDDLPF